MTMYSHNFLLRFDNNLVKCINGRLYIKMSDTVSVNITYTQETADHDSYCSGDECGYETEDFDIATTVKLSNIKLDTEGNIIDLQLFEQYVPEPKLNMNGSGYCQNSKESKAHGLYGHDSRITITGVKFV